MRKAGAALERAGALWRQGAALGMPSECGYWLVQRDLEPEAWLAASAPLEGPVADTFWPGPLRLRLPSASGKRSWQIPSHPLARAWLEQLGEPVAARLLPGPQRTPPEQGLDAVLIWKEPCLGLSYSEADLACLPWRWLRSGFVTRREFEWVAGQPTLLSGPALPGCDGPSPVQRQPDLKSWRWER